MGVKTRIFEVVTRVKTDDGEKIIDEDIIKIALAHRTIKRWAYILHDKDVYSLQDEAEDKNEKIKHGNKKPSHYHIVCELTQSIDLETIAKWFKIAPNFVEKKKGAGAFLDCVEYLTHESDKEQAKGKFLYADENVKCNFDFRKELEKRKLNKIKYGKDLNPRDVQRVDVLLHGKTLAQCQDEDPVLYMNDVSALVKAREQYLAKKDPPKTRINFYIYGTGGIGKGLASRALARALFPGLKDDETFFEVGSENANFDGYDGQPVIIWNDCRASELLKKLKGRGNVFNVFDTHPTRGKQSIKFGVVNLVNSVNIVNSVQPHTEFLEELITNKKEETKEDPNQSYRRFPFIIPLREDDFDLLANKGFLENNNLFTEYIQYKNIRGNFGKLRKTLGVNEEKCREIENKMLTIPVEQYQKATEKNGNENEVDMTEFEHYGEQKSSLEKRMEKSYKTKNEE